MLKCLKKEREKEGKGGKEGKIEEIKVFLKNLLLKVRKQNLIIYLSLLHLNLLKVKEYS